MQPDTFSTFQLLAGNSENWVDVAPWASSANREVTARARRETYFL
jgi:hypothetical protein